MADNAAALQRVVLAKETTHGTPPASGYKELGSLSIVPSPDVAAEPFTPQGQLVPTVAGVNQESAQLALTGRGTYTELQYLLASLLYDTTPSTPGGATLTRRWLWQWGAAVETDPATFAILRGGPSRSEQSAYSLFTQATLAYSRNNGLQITGGQGRGRLLRDNSAWYLQTTGGPTGGSVTIRIGVQDSPATPTVTVAIAHDAAAADVEAALNALFTIGDGGVSVSGTGPWVVTFDGTLVAGRDVPMLELVSNNLSGGTNPSVGIVETTPGAPTPTNEVQTISLSGSPTGGSFTLRMPAMVTATIAYNAAASAIETALEATPAVLTPDVDVVVSGGALGTNPVRIGFGGQWSGAPAPAVTVVSALTGGTSPAVTIQPFPFTVTALDLVPILGNQFAWYLAGAQVDLASAARLTRMFAVSVGIQNTRDVFYPMNDDLESFDGHVIDQPTTQITFTIGADDTGMALTSQLRRGDTVFLKGVATGPLIEAGFPYQLTITIALKLTGRSERKAEQKLVAVDYTAVLTKDPTWGYAFEAILDNDQASL
jgi:hypothetical protein